jgi:hypothetical protein
MSEGEVWAGSQTAEGENEQEKSYGQLKERIFPECQDEVRAKKYHAIRLESWN